MGRPINNIRKANLRIKVGKSNYKKLLTLGRSVSAALTGNANFVAPMPALTVLNGEITDLAASASNMGGKRNRGSKANLADAQLKTTNLRSTLLALLAYVLNTASIGASPDSPLYAQILSTSGFGFKSTRKIGAQSQIATFVRQTNNKTFNAATNARINWKRPLGLIKGAKVAGYEIHSIADPTFAPPIVNALIAVTTKTNYSFANPSAGLRSYKVVPFNSRGKGGAITIQVQGLVS